MLFQNPTYLWALLGLLIPLAIHLWSKREGKTIKVGSIKLLSEADSKRSSSIRLNEILLLLMRLAIVGLLAIILAEPTTNQPIKNAEVSYLVEPSLLANANIAKFIDSLQETATVYRFESGVAELENTNDPFENIRAIDYWKWMREAENLRADSIVIFSKGLISGLKGRRPSLNKPFEIILMSLDEKEEQLLDVTLGETKARILTAESASMYTNVRAAEIPVQKLKVNQSRDSVLLSVSGEERRVKVNGHEPLRLSMLIDPKLKDQAGYVKAALNVVSKLTARNIEVTEIERSELANLTASHVLFWLSREPPPSSKAKVLSIREEDLADSLIEEGTKDGLYHITERLNSENIVAKDFVECLIDFLGLYSEAKNKMTKISQRIATKNDMTPNQSKVIEANIVPQSMSVSKWLWIVMIILMVVERLLANFRKQ